MDNEQKSLLEKAIFSQNFNKHVANALVSAIEEDLKIPKVKKARSTLQIAIENEKGKKFVSGSDALDSSED